MRYILDTSVIVKNPRIYDVFPDQEFVIPIIVLEELDHLKHQSGEKARNSRIAIKYLDELTKGVEDICSGIKLENGSTLFIDQVSYNCPIGEKDTNDLRIIASALHHSKSHKVTLLSNDVNMKVRARILGIEADSQESYKTDLSDLYTGIEYISNDEMVADLYENGNCVDPEKYGYEIVDNQYVVFDNGGRTDGGTCCGRMMDDGLIHLIADRRPDSSSYWLKPKSVEQFCANDALLDKDIPLVTMIGAAGSGKTVLGLAAGLDLVVNKRHGGIYKKLVLYKSIMPVGADVGYLPGPQPLSAKILTPTGWTTMGEIKVGDFVIGRNGQPTKVLGIFPKGEKEIYKVTTTDGTSTECCEDHLWHTTTNEERVKGISGHIRHTWQISETLLDKTGGYNHILPRNKAIQFADKKLTISAYNFGKMIAKDMDKSIPNIYKYSSVDQRMSLLRGLMDILGEVKNTTGEVYFTTESEQLSADVIELIRSLGGKAVLNKNTSSKFSINILIEDNPFYISDKAIGWSKLEISDIRISEITNTNRKELTQCILVEDEEHLYITDDFIVTHNTLDEKMAHWFGSLWDGFEFILENANSPGEWKHTVDMWVKKGLIKFEALTFIRGRSISNAVVLFDENQNLSREEVKTLITRIGDNCKLILTGDIEQIDNPKLDAMNNGLTYVVEQFKGNPVSAHITLKECERSILAEVASRIL